MTGDNDKKVASTGAEGGGFFSGFSRGLFMTQKPASDLTTKDDSGLTSSAAAGSTGIAGMSGLAGMSGAASNTGSGVATGTATGTAGAATSGGLLGKIAMFGAAGGNPAGGGRRRATVADFSGDFDSIIKKQSESSSSVGGGADKPSALASLAEEPAVAPTPSQLGRRASMPVSMLGGFGKQETPSASTGEAAGGKRGSSGNLWGWLTQSKPGGAGGEQRQPSLLNKQSTIMETGEINPMAGGITRPTGKREQNAFTPSGW